MERVKDLGGRELRRERVEGERVKEGESLGGRELRRERVEEGES